MLAITGRRLRARPGRALLVSAGVTVAVAFLTGVAGGSAVSEDLALRHALAALPPAERALRVAWSGQTAPGGYAALDRSAQRAAGSLTAEPLTRSVELNDVRFGAGLVKLAAVSGLGRYVHLREGRLPRACTPAHCEVIQIGGSSLSRVNEYGVHLDVVGRGALTSLVPFGASGLATQPSAGGIRPEPVLLSSSVRGLASLPPLLLFSRSYGWTAAFSPGSAHVWDVDRLLASEGRAEARLTAANGQFGITAPDDALTQARSAGSTASRRVLLVGGAAAVLLLAFAGLTAGALRRDVRAELRRLGQRGATLSQQAAFLLAESLSAVLPGVAGGLAIGIAAVAIIAHRSRVPVGPALSHGLATPASVTLVAAGSLGALAVVALALRRQDGARPAGVRPVDMAAVGAVVALALLLAGGSRDGGTLSAGPAFTLAATPLLASFAFAVLLGRLLEPAIRTGLRASRKAPVTLRLALLALHRSPSRAAGVAGFLAVSVGLATFALSYRATLDSSSAERAAYAVPLDYTLNEGAALVAPRDAATLKSYRGLAPGVGAWPILRQVADAAGSRGAPLTPTVIGVPAAVLPQLHGWRSDFSAQSPAELARLLRPNGRVALAGAVIPRSATRLTLPVRMTGAAAQLVLVVQTAGGDAAQLRPPVPPKGVDRMLGVPVPPALRGGRVTAIQLQLPSNDQRSAAHGGAEGRNGAKGFAGTLVLGPLAAMTPAGAVGLAPLAGWRGHGGVEARRNGDSLTLRYVIDTSQQAVLRPHQPFDDRRLPVVASPDVAASAGVSRALELSFGGQVVHARLVAVAKRFPTTQDSGDSFVVADEASLASALGADDLPSSIPDELWLSTPAGSDRRASPPRCASRPSQRSTSPRARRSTAICRAIRSRAASSRRSSPRRSPRSRWRCSASRSRRSGSCATRATACSTSNRRARARARCAPACAGARSASRCSASSPASGSASGWPSRPAACWRSTPRSRCQIRRSSASRRGSRSPPPPVLALLAAALVEASLRVAYRRGAAGRGVTGEQWAE